MKRINILLFILLSTGLQSLFAQFPEGFETTVPPTGWASFIGTNGLGTTHDWTTITTANSGNQAARIRWEDVTGGMAEDWLVTPQFTPTSTTEGLSFFQRQGFPNDFGSVYTVRVSTASQNIHADFVIVDTQVETDFGTAYTEKIIDLSAYAGTPIYVAFVLENDNGDSWYIDDVSQVDVSGTSYCTSVPSFVDGTGLGDVTVGTTTYTSSGTVAYQDYTGGIKEILNPNMITNVLITFETGFSYNANIWIDFNDDFNFDQSELVFSGIAPSSNPNTFDASFTIPFNSAKGVHRMRLGTNDATFYSTPDPCFNGPYGVTLDFNVDISCENTSQFPFSSITAPSFSGISTTISTCIYAGEFALIDGIQNGQTYRYTSQLNGVPDYITVRDAGSNAILAQGVSPVFVTAMSITDMEIHVNLNDGNCGTDNTICHTATVGCLSCPCQTPANDVCSSSTGIFVGQGSCFGPTNFEITTCATSSGQLPAPSCGNYISQDVWFSMIVPASGSLVIETSADATGFNFNTAIELYSGTCGGLTSIACNDDDPAGGTLFSKLDLSGLASGSTVYLRIWEFGGNDYGTCNVCAWDPDPCPDDYAAGGLANSRPAASGFLDNSLYYETDGSIISTQEIGSVMPVIFVDYNSGTDITLNSGFEVHQGAVFHAFIDGCFTSGAISSGGGSGSYKNGSGQSKNLNTDVEANRSEKAAHERAKRDNERTVRTR